MVTDPSARSDDTLFRQSLAVIFQEVVHARKSGANFRPHPDRIWAQPTSALRSRLGAMEQVIEIVVVIVAIDRLADKAFFSPIEFFLHGRRSLSP